VLEEDMLRFLNWQMALLIACLLTVLSVGLFWVSAPGKVVVWRGETKILPKERNERRIRLGASIAVDGNLAVMGAPADQLSGAAYIYERVGSKWVEQAKLQPQDQDFYDVASFGMEVAISGDTAVVGTVSNAIYVFVRQGDRWIQQAKLTADINSLDTLADSLAFSQNTIVVAADVLASPQSHIFFVFERDPKTGTWSEATQILPPPGKILFGQAAAIDGDTMVLSDLKRAMVFVRTSSNRQWTYQATLTDDHPDRTTLFGYDVALDNHTVVVGAPLELSSFIRTGAAYVFQRHPETGQWKRKAKLIPRGANVGNFVSQFINPYEFGGRVAVRDDKILVGSCTGRPHGGTAFFSSPETAAYFYQQDSQSGEWQQRSKILGDSSTSIGCGSMSIANQDLLIKDAGVINPDQTRGAVIVFNLEKYLTAEKSSN
jgi:FG-GAP repeat